MPPEAIGEADGLGIEGVLRVTAPNAGPMTYRGTNSYIVGTCRECIVVDPGPDDPAHLAALQEHVGERQVGGDPADPLASGPHGSRGQGGETLRCADLCGGEARRRCRRLRYVGDGEGRGGRGKSRASIHGFVTRALDRPGRYASR